MFDTGSPGVSPISVGTPAANAAITNGATAGIGAGTGVITDLIAPVVTTVGGIVTTNMTNEANKQMNQENNALNERLYREQVEYNKPVNQMLRLQAAGLNPAMMYGTGSSLNVAGAPPHMNPSHAENPAAFLSNFSQIRNLDAQRENINQQTENAKKLAVGIDLDNKAKKHNLDNVKNTSANVGENTFSSQIIRGVKWFFGDDAFDKKKDSDNSYKNQNTPEHVAGDRHHGATGSW